MKTGNWHYQNQNTKRQSIGISNMKQAVTQLLAYSISTVDDQFSAVIWTPSGLIVVAEQTQ